MKLLLPLTDVVRRGLFEVTTPEESDAGVIRTVVYINGDVVTTVCAAARDPAVVAEHFRSVAERGQAARNRLRRLRFGAWALWAVFVAAGTAVAPSLAAMGVVLASALVTAALRWIHVSSARARVRVELLKIFLLIVLAVLSNIMGHRQVAIGSAVSAVLDLILFISLAVGRRIVRHALRDFGVPG